MPFVKYLKQFLMQSMHAKVKVIVVVAVVITLGLTLLSCYIRRLYSGSSEFLLRSWVSEPMVAG